MKALVGLADFAHSSDVPRNEGCDGGRNGAAVRLGMARTTLIYRMKRLGITALSPRRGVAI